MSRHLQQSLMSAKILYNKKTPLSKINLEKNNEVV